VEMPEWDVYLKFYVRLCQIAMLVFYASRVMMNRMIGSQLPVAIGLMMLSST
jgi:hypothetical protein